MRTRYLDCKLSEELRNLMLYFRQAGIADAAHDAESMMLEAQRLEALEEEETFDWEEWASSIANGADLDDFRAEAEDSLTVVRDLEKELGEADDAGTIIKTAQSVLVEELRALEGVPFEVDEILKRYEK